VEVPVTGILDTGDYVLDLVSGTQDHFMLANPYDRAICPADSSIEVIGVSNHAIVYNPQSHGYDPINISTGAATIGAWKAFFVQKTATPAQVKFSYPDIARDRSEHNVQAQQQAEFSTKPREPKWEVVLSAGSGDFAGKAIVGIAKDAADAYDPMDVLALPPMPFAPSAKIDLYIDNSHWEAQDGHYIRDIKANNGDFWSWELMLDIQNLLEEDRFSGTVQIGILENQKPLSGYSLHLIDPNNQAIVNLREAELILDLDIDASNAGIGQTPWLIPLRLEVAAISEHAEAPRDLLTTHNYPNPFNPSTTICYSLGKEAQVSLDIYNVKGQKVRSLYHGKQDKGTHTIVWDGKDASGRETSSGFYFYRLNADGKQVTRKILMLK
jgi:hypothetical protein